MSVTKLCDKVDMTRQNFYKIHTVRQRRDVDEKFVKDLVLAERVIQPRLGGRKLRVILRPELEKADLYIGRDRFFEILRNQGLLLKRLPKAPRTTNSHHNHPVFTNLLHNFDLVAPNQIWASDITYIRTSEEFLYLSLTTDMYSRKIVGWHLSPDLTASETLKALEMALAEKPKGSSPIHHSDRGSQYCSHLYVSKLNDFEMAVSMTEENHCAENALAERVNGILKQEYGLGYEFRNELQTFKAAKEAVYLYNNRRPHMALEYNTPEQIHGVA